MNRLVGIVLVLLHTVSAMAGTMETSGSGAAKSTILVRVDRSGNQYICAVNGKSIAPSIGKLPYVDLDKALGEQILEQGRRQVVAIVIGSKVSLEDMFLVRTVAQKVGYQTVRFFLANPEARQMSEISLGAQFQLPAGALNGDPVPVVRQ